MQSNVLKSILDRKLQKKKDDTRAKDFVALFATLEVAQLLLDRLMGYNVFDKELMEQASKLSELMDKNIEKSYKDNINTVDKEARYQKESKCLQDAVLAVLKSDFKEWVVIPKFIETLKNQSSC